MGSSNILFVNIEHLQNMTCTPLPKHHRISVIVPAMTAIDADVVVLSWQCHIQQVCTQTVPNILYILLE